MNLIYTLARPYRDRVFVETGETLDAEQYVEMPADALTPALRAHLVRTAGPAVPAEFLLKTYSSAYNAAYITSFPGNRITLEALATEADAVRLLSEDAARWEAAEAARQVEAARIAERHAKDEAEEQARIEARSAAALAEAQERVRRDAEKRAWIEAHGSDFLRRACLKGGYDCQRRYVTERAATERPGYVVDFHDKAQWKDRACPSERALDEAERVGGRVVWLTTYPVDDGNPDEYEGGWEQESEAVVIRGYLGKYYLIRLM